jgi:hypothetical protein
MLNRILRRLQQGDATAAGINEGFGMSERRLMHLIKVLHDRRAIHITDWEQHAVNNMPRPVYRKGDGEDKARPLSLYQLTTRLIDPNDEQALSPSLARQRLSELREQRSMEQARREALKRNVAPKRDVLVEALFGAYQPTKKPEKEQA